MFVFPPVPGRPGVTVHVAGRLQLCFHRGGGKREMDVVADGTTTGDARGWSRRGFLGTSAAALLAGEGAAAEPATLAGSIAEAIVALRGAAVPAAVAERMVWTVLDNLGVIAFGSGLEAPASFAAYMATRTGAPRATILGTGRPAAAESAAAANAYLVHAAEIDDSDLRSQLRASAVLFPAVLAAAEAQDATGSAFVKALALGYTLQGRLAAPLGPIQAVGWMASGVWGPPAAAAAVADLMRLPADRIAAALSLGGSAGGGLFQYYFDQTEEKRLIVARAARLGVESALLASRGEAGSPRILEGQAGMYRQFGAGRGRAPTAAELVADLGRLEGPLFVYPKFYAASHSIIPTLDGLALDLPRGFDPRRIRSFVVRGDEGYANSLGRKVDRFEAPANAFGAMLNFSYVVALYLLKGSVMPADYSPANLRDPELLALAGKGRFETVATPFVLETEFVMDDGRRVKSLSRYPKPTDPAPPNEPLRRRKLAQLTAGRLDDRGRARLIDHCRALPEARSMRRWVAEAQTLLRG